MNAWSSLSSLDTMNEGLLSRSSSCVCTIARSRGNQSQLRHSIRSLLKKQPGLSSLSFSPTSVRVSEARAQAQGEKGLP